MGTSSNLIRIETEQALESLMVETFINTSPKVTKVSDESALRGLIRGNVRVGKKALKDIALSVSHMFPDSATGSSLDDVADDHGIAPRFAAAQSSTYVRLIANPGTVYQSGVNSVSDNKGNVFDLSNDITIDASGYGYVKVRSQQSGSATNVDPYTIININPAPSGHIGVLNEYGATGGRDLEDDDTFRQRIKEGPDILARGTLSYLTQAFMKINPNVLRVIYEGVNEQGKVTLGILTVNGVDLTSDELSILLDSSGDYFSLTELSPIGYVSKGVVLQNVTYSLIDVDFRMAPFAGVDVTEIIKEIQVKFSKYCDFRFFEPPSDKIIWTDLLQIVRGMSGVKSVSDSHFLPNVDISLPYSSFPRFRAFIVRDLDGNVIESSPGIKNIYYSNSQNATFISTVV